jgi:P-aminobenzoate N-oxygenase AurF
MGTVCDSFTTDTSAPEAVAGRNTQTQSVWCDSVVDWSSEVDHRRMFVCPTLTPLYYAAVYRDLTAAQQLRYNQVSAISFNDLILFFERSFARALESLLRHPRRQTPEFQTELEGFLADEQRHCEMWRRLNLASFPRKQDVDDYRVIRVGWPLRMLLSVLTNRPRRFPVVVLMMLTLEEHSIEMSRRCARVSVDILEPHYRDAFRAHLLDEARHVRVDSRMLLELIEPLSVSARRLNAAIFQLFIRKLWLRPARAAARVVNVLAAEFPELRPIRSRLRAGLAEAGNNREYRRMMLSTSTAPLLFRLLRLYPEFCPAEMKSELRRLAEGQLT